MCSKVSDWPSHHLFTQEILLQRAFANTVILKGDVPVRAERARQHGDIAEHGLERFVQDIAHLDR